MKHVALVYHFFADYRRPVLDVLARDHDYSFEFVADTQNRLMPGVKIWTPAPYHSFKEARCRPIAHGFMVQHGVVGLAFRKSLDAIIYLGDWKWPSTWVSAILARIAGKRVLFWTHGWRAPDKGILKSRLRRAFYSIPHGLLLYGNRARDIGISMGFHPSKLHVLFNSLDHERQLTFRRDTSREKEKATRHRLFGNAHHPVVLCSSRLRKDKRLGDLFRVAAKLDGQGHPLNVIIIGDGSVRHELENMAQTLGVKVHFEGECFDERRIAELTSASTVTVVPGPIGLTAVQSMAYGVPVITNDNFSKQGPESEAIVPGVTGDFFRCGNLKDLAEKMRHWTVSATVDAHVRNNCFAIVDTFFTPGFQAGVIRSALNGEPAMKYDLRTALPPQTTTAQKA